MKTKRRVLSWILALVLLLSFCLAGCENGQSAQTQAGTDSSAITEAPAADTLVLIQDGAPMFTVMRSDNSASGKADVSMATQIRKVLSNLGKEGVTNFTIETDWLKKGEEHDPDKWEILVGHTNYAESAQVAAATKYGDYTVQVVGKKVVIFAYSDEGLEKAADAFMDAVLLKSEKSGTEDAPTVTVKVEDVVKTYTMDKVASAMPLYENGTFNTIYDAGDSCSELIFEKTTADAYKAYVEKLKAAGYTEYTRNEVNNNIFTTLYNAQNTLQVGYYNYNKNVRIIIEPYADTTLPPLEAPQFTAVTTSQLTMLGLDYVSTKDDGTSERHGNGMSIILRLSDGRFIVIDGGFNTANHYNNFKKVLKEQAKEYDPEGKNITVACWMITHSHGDHQGLIQGKYNNLKADGIKVENFLVNFMSDTERNKSMASTEKDEGGVEISKNWSSGEGGGWSKIYTAASTLGANMLIAHVGQIYYFADWKLEILFTVESYAPTTVNALNATSLIVKMTHTDPATGKQTVYMSTGDATGTDFQIAVNTFGSYMKADLVQIAHHGYTTWHNDNGTKNAYKTIAAATLIWPQGLVANPSYVNKGYNKAAWDLESNPNYKETYVAGNMGDIIVCPMPYTVGSATVTRVEQ